MDPARAVAPGRARGPARQRRLRVAGGSCAGARRRCPTAPPRRAPESPPPAAACAPPTSAPSPADPGAAHAPAPGVLDDARRRERAPDQAAGEGDDVGSAHAAGVGDDAGGDDDEELSDNVLGRQRLATGDVDAALDGAAVPRPGRSHELGHQGYLEPQVRDGVAGARGRARRQRGTQGAFSARQTLAELLGLRWTASACARRRSAARSAASCDRPSRSWRRPRSRCAARCALALTRTEDMAAANPAPGAAARARGRRDRRGRAHRRCAARIVVDRGATTSWASSDLGACSPPGPYRWRAHDLARLGVLTNRVGFGAYRAPGAPPAAFAIETLIDELAAAARRSTRSSCGCATCCARATRPRRPGVPDLRRRASASSALRDAPAVGAPRRAARRRGRRRRARLAGRAAWSRRRRVCRLDADGRLTVITGAVDMSGIETVFATIAAETFGLSLETRARRRRRHRQRALRRRERRQQGHLHGRPRRRARGRRGARAAARRRLRRSSRSRPRTSRSSTARCARSARPAARSARRARGQGARLRQPARADRGLRRRRPDQPRAGRGRAPLARARRPRDRRA